MATKNIVPRADGEGGIGTAAKAWLTGFIKSLTCATQLITDTIAEKTSAAGVTIDGMQIKDSQPYTDQINEKTGAAGVTTDGCLHKDGITYADTISEKTSAAGVTVDGVLNKDGGIVTTGDIYNTALTDISANVEGFSSTSPCDVKYKKFGKTVLVYWYILGVSNQGYFRITGLPAAGDSGTNNTWNGAAYCCFNNSGAVEYVCDAMIADGGTVLNFYYKNGAWTSSGNKYCRGFFIYEAAA